MSCGLLSNHSYVWLGVQNVSMHRVLDFFAFVAILGNGGLAIYLITKKGGVIYSVFLGAGEMVSGQKCFLHKCEDMSLIAICHLKPFECYRHAQTWEAELGRSSRLLRLAHTALSSRKSASQTRGKVRSDCQC